MTAPEQKQPQVARIRHSRRVKPVNLDYLHLQLLVVLRREAGRLLDLSFKEKLSEESSKTLVNYLKLLKDLKQQEAEELENLSDEELEKLSKKGEKHG